MPRYTAANIDTLLPAEITTKLLQTEVKWDEISEEQRDALIARMRADFNASGRVRVVSTEWEKARVAGGVTVDELKLVDMDGDPEFQLLRKHGEFSPEGWFLYFWKEGKNSIANAGGGEKTKLNEMARTFFVKDNDSYKLAPTVRANQRAGADPDFRGWLTRNPAAAVKFGEWLEILLRLGFKSYVANKDDLMARSKSKLVNPSGDLACADNVALAKDLVKTPFTWRADSRPLSEVAGEGGFNTKADQSKGYAATHGLSEAWNPFSKPEINKYYWFRKSSNDNCKYTVVSVGMESDWKKVISFPLLRDLHSWPSEVFTKPAASVRQFSTLGAADQKRVSDWFNWGWMLPAVCMIDGTVVPGPVLLPAVRTHLYLLILGGAVINTNAIQGKGDSFPEVGVRSLSLKHIYGEVEVTRFYHGADDERGYTAFVSGFDTVKNQGRSKRFARTEDALRAQFDAIAKHGGALHLRWASDGCAPIEPEFRVSGKRIKIIGMNKTAKPMQCSILW